ncbi:MAG TPA: ABC transporter substrate-binding protein, partial [Kofleriaceae bacterium]|nr:ABC transporter substrate-binding protein [Kofleriaceae bacterium]
MRRLVVAACALAVACRAPTAAPTGDAVERGRAIFQRGVTARGPAFTAELGAGNLVPAAALPCANCHGRDGRGRLEGGIAPPDLRWSSLTRPYQVVTDTGRSRPAYTAARLGRAITLGIDAGGERLGEAMPHYRLTRDELADLLAYLQVLEREPQDPGIDDHTIRIGLVLDGEHGDAAQVLAGAFDAFNREGGVFGRQLALRTLRLPAAADAQAAALRGFLEREAPLALFGELPARGGDVLAAVLERQRVPFIGARAVAGPSPSPERYVFYVEPGAAQEAAALTSFAARQRAGARTVIVHAADAAGEAAARFVAERARRT